MQLERLKEWRESRGLTQRELAEQAGVGEVTVARVETGASVRPNTARKIAGALGVAVPDLLAHPPAFAESAVPLAETPKGSASSPPEPPEGERREEIEETEELFEKVYEWVEKLAHEYAASGDREGVANLLRASSLVAYGATQHMVDEGIFPATDEVSKRAVDSSEKLDQLVSRLWNMAEGFEASVVKGIHTASGSKKAS